VDDEEKSQEQIENDLIYKWLSGIGGKPFVYLINELFKENYPVDSKIEIVSNQALVNVELSIVIMDTLIILEYDSEKKSMHIELQTIKGSNIPKRMLDYGFRYAIEDMEENSYTSQLPKQIVLFIEENQNIKDFIECNVKFYNYLKKQYDVFNYKIPTYKIFAKDLEELKSKHLSILLPFKISMLNKELKRSKTDSQKKRILDKLIPLIDKIISNITTEYKSGYLTFEEFEKIMNALKHLSDFFYNKLTLLCI
jgi:hypothetical protein